MAAYNPSDDVTLAVFSEAEVAGQTLVGMVKQYKSGAPRLALINVVGDREYSVGKLPLTVETVAFLRSLADDVEAHLSEVDDV